MKLNNYLIKSIKNDLTELFNNYIDDADKDRDLDTIMEYEDKILKLDDMSLEELVELNLEYIHHNELKVNMQDMVAEWLNNEY